MFISIYPKLLLKRQHSYVKMTETHRNQIAQLKRKIASQDVQEMFVKCVLILQSAYAERPPAGMELGIQMCPHFPKCLCRASSHMDGARHTDVLLRKCMKYIQSISPKGIISNKELSIKEIAINDEITKPPICFGTYPIVVAGNIKTVEMRGDYDCRVIILKNTETNDFTLDIDALEKMTELREIRFQFIKKYMPGVNTAIHLVKMGETINYYAFIGWCSRRRIRLSMTIGGQPVTVDWKAVFF
jgi:hypothetical protein